MFFGSMNLIKMGKAGQFTFDEEADAGNKQVEVGDARLDLDDWDQASHQRGEYFDGLFCLLSQEKQAEHFR